MRDNQTFNQVRIVDDKALYNHCSQRKPTSIGLTGWNFSIKFSNRSVNFFKDAVSSISGAWPCPKRSNVTQVNFCFNSLTTGHHINRSKPTPWTKMINCPVPTVLNSVRRKLGSNQSVKIRQSRLCPTRCDQRHSVALNISKLLIQKTRDNFIERVHVLQWWQVLCWL